MSGGVTRVWWVAPSGRVAGKLLVGVPCAAALLCWISVLRHPDIGHLVAAAEGTAFSAAFSLFSWACLLRVRLELTPDAVVMVNPWGTQRLPWTRVAALSRGNTGARFHTADGFTFTAYALSDLSSFGFQQGDRYAQVERAVQEHLTPAG